MTSLDTRRYEMLARVREFGVSHPELFPSGSRPADLLATVTSLVDELSHQFTVQQAGSAVSRAGASNRATLRERVREHLEAMRRSAREIAAEHPGVDRQFRLPRSTSDQTLLGIARSFVVNAEPIKPQFERQLLDAEFFAALEADIAAFERAQADQRRGRDTRVEATATIATAIDLGLRSIRSLDTLILNRYGDEPTVLATWKSARRIHSSNARGHAPTPETASPGKAACAENT